MERRGIANLEKVEVVTFPGEDGDGDLPTDGDGPVASGDGPTADPGGPLAAPPPSNGGGAKEDDDLPTLLSSTSRMRMMRTFLPHQ